MLFNTFRFILAFAPAFLLGFYALRRQSWRVAFMALASYAFYAYANHFYPLLLLTATLWAWGAALLLDRVAEERRRAAMWLGIAGPLAVLVAFKYTAFLVGDTASLVETLTGRGFPTLKTFARVVLPVGTSFYTFEAISYVVDVHRRWDRGRSGTCWRFWRPSWAYFPHLDRRADRPLRAAGAAAAPLPPLPTRSSSSRVSCSFAARAREEGADRRHAGRVSGCPSRSLNPAGLHLVDGWVAVFAFAAQIYFDFAGYTDMALGLSRMIGIDLPWNFDRPARAPNPSDFWNRWNVTLSRWLRDYLDVLLNHGGGGRKTSRGRKQARRDVTLLITMAIAGLLARRLTGFPLLGPRRGRARGGRAADRDAHRHQAPHLARRRLHLHRDDPGRGALPRPRHVARAGDARRALRPPRRRGRRRSRSPSSSSARRSDEWRSRRSGAGSLRAGPACVVALAGGLGAAAGLAFVWMIAPPHPFVYFQF